MDTRHGTQVFSFLLMRSVSGLLINGCSKSKRHKEKKTKKRQEKKWEEGGTRRIEGLLAFFDAA